MWALGGFGRRGSSNKTNQTSASYSAKSVISFSVCQNASVSDCSQRQWKRTAWSRFSPCCFWVAHANPKKLRHHGNHQLSCMPQSPREPICGATCCRLPVCAYMPACVRACTSYVHVRADVHMWKSEWCEGGPEGGEGRINPPLLMEPALIRSSAVQKSCFSPSLRSHAAIVCRCHASWHTPLCPFTITVRSHYRVIKNSLFSRCTVNASTEASTVKCKYCALCRLNPPSVLRAERCVLFLFSAF